MADTATKSWWKSKTVISGVVALLGGIGTVFGYEIAPEEQAKIVEVISEGMIFIGSLGAIFSNIKASKKSKE